MARLDTTRSDGASRRVTGLGLAAAAAALWALGGLAAQDLFARHHVDPGWLVGVRMASGGLLLLAVFRPAWPRGHTRLLIAVAVLGIAGGRDRRLAARGRRAGRTARLARTRPGSRSPSSPQCCTPSTCSARRAWSPRPVPGRRRPGG